MSKLLEGHVSPVLAFAQPGLGGRSQTKCVQQAQTALWQDLYLGFATGNPHFQTVVNHGVQIWAHQHEHRPPPWTGS